VRGVLERPETVQRVLLVQLAQLGDVLHCTPAIRAARRALPHARIDFLSRGPGVDALQGNPCLDDVLGYPKGLPAVLGLVREIRRRRYDVVVDFHSNPRTAPVVAASGVPVRIGLRGRGPRNRAYTRLFSRDEMAGSYSAAHKVDLLRQAGFQVPPGADEDLALDVAIGESERRWAEVVWRRLGISDHRPTVVLSAVSREGYKNWGLGRWAEVADGLIEAGAQVLLTNGPGELEQVEAVAGKMRAKPFWNHGATSVREMAALYERCDLWVGNDGGPKHLAVAAGVPTVTVIRWTHGPNWTDTRPGSPHVFLERPPPQGCDLRCVQCPHLACLGAIPAADVRAAALASLRSRGAEVKETV
jgi:ADP-heptose:LPS heptosyltransferase